MTDPRTPRREVNPTLVLAASYGWRLIVVAAVVVGAVWLLGELWVIVLALVVAAFVARALDAPTRWLRARGARPALAASVSLIGGIAVLVAIGWVVLPSVVDQVSEVGPTLDAAVDEVEDWLVDDSPFDISRSELAELRAEASDALGRSLRASSDSIASGAFAALEAVLGLLLALVTAFFILKDGERFQEWIVGRLPAERRVLARRVGSRSWSTLGGYLKGAAVLGLVEGTIIGITMAIAGASLALPVALITFVAAFVPILGAIAAGAIATLVTLSTAGFGAALVVLVVVVVVQQLDNDLLSPVIYGKALALHPLVILFSVVAGGALFGIGGTLLAVPVTAVVLNALDEASIVRAEEAEASSAE